MSLRARWYSYAAAIFLGLLVAFFLTPLLRAEGVAWLQGLGIFGAVCAMLGFALGITWTDKSWRWGLWLIAPLVLLTALSLLFTGIFRMFLTRDVPTLLVAAIAASGGGYLGARFGRRPRDT